jgi:hypothetical protein
MNQVSKGLLQLGYDTGWAVSGEEIILWELSTPMPSMQEILEAAKNYVKPEPTVADKLASVGLSLDELKSAILGGN